MRKSRNHCHIINTSQATYVGVQEPQAVVEEEAFSPSESSDDREDDDFPLLDIRMHKHFVQLSIVHYDFAILAELQNVDRSTVRMNVTCRCHGELAYSLCFWKFLAKQRNLN